MIRARLASVMCAAAVFLWSAANANSWPKEPGDVEIIGNATIYRQESGLTGGAASAFSDFHLEYGADTHVTLLGDASFQQYVAAHQSVAAFDTAWLGVRTDLGRWDNSVFSAEFHAGLSGIRELPSVHSRIALDGTAEMRATYGEGFDVLNRHAFAGVEGGWRWRGGPPADEFLVDTIAGIAPWPTALLMLQSFSIVGVGAARGAYRRYDLVKLQLSLAQQVRSRWWVQAGIIGAVAGADSGDAGAVLALWSRF